MLDRSFTGHIVNRPMYLCLFSFWFQLPFVFLFLFVLFVFTRHWFIIQGPVTVYRASAVFCVCLLRFNRFNLPSWWRHISYFLIFSPCTHICVCMFVCQYIKRPYGPVGEAAVERSQAHKGIGPKKTRPPSLTLTLTGRCQIPPGSSVRPMELFLWQVQVRPCKLWQRPFLHNSRVDLEIHIIDAIFAL